MKINRIDKDCFLVNSGNNIISMVTLKEKYDDSYLEYLSEEVEKRFLKLYEENEDFEFDELYNILNGLEEIEEIQVLNSFIINA